MIGRSSQPRIGRNFTGASNDEAQAVFIPKNQVNQSNKSFIGHVLQRENRRLLEKSRSKTTKLPAVVSLSLL